MHPFRIVRFDDTDGEVRQAAGSTDGLFGRRGSLGADSAEDRIDVHVAGTSTRTTSPSGRASSTSTSLTMAPTPASDISAIRWGRRSR